jgi:hypothetical protein
MAGQRTNGSREWEQTMLKLPKKDMNSFGSVRLTIEISTGERFGEHGRLLSLFDNSSEQREKKPRSLTAVESSFVFQKDPYNNSYSHTICRLPPSFRGDVNQA